MQIVSKNLTEINGTITTDENGNIIITIPPVDSSGFKITRVDASGLKDVTNASVIAYVEDRSDDMAKIQEIITKALEIKARLNDTQNPPCEIEKSVLYTELSELNRQLQSVDPSLTIYQLI